MRKFAKIVICAATASCMSAPAAAQLLSDWGYGSFNLDHAEEGPTLASALGLPELYEADGDVFRFSSAPALGGSGFVITLSELPKGAGHIQAILVRGHNGLGWARQATLEARLSAETYVDALARIDTLYHPPDYTEIPNPDDPDRVIALCSDGPGYLSERSRDGEVTWLSGFCANNHPNLAIARIMHDLVERSFAEAWRDPRER